MRISEPCPGLFSASGAFKEAFVDYVPVNVYEHLQNASGLYEHMFGDVARTFNLGHEHGCMLSVPLCALEDSHGLISGPPCPLWSAKGRRQGLKVTSGRKCTNVSYNGASN